MRFSSILLTLFAAITVFASPMEQDDQNTELSQTEAYELLDQFAASAQLSQSEALDLLEEYAQLEAEGEDAEIIPAIIGGVASVALPYVAKKVLPAIGKAVLPAAGRLAKKVIDKVRGSKH